MKVFIVIAALVSIARAGVIVNSPLLRSPFVPFAPFAPLTSIAPIDSAVVHSQQLGGNFAYRVAQGPHFQTLAPLSHIAALRAPLGLASPYWAHPGLVTPHLVVDPTLNVALRDAAQRQLDSDLQVRDQIVEQQRQLLQNHEDSVRTAVEAQLEAQRQLNDQALVAAQNAQVAQEAALAAQVPVEVPAPVEPTVVDTVASAPETSGDDDSVVIDSADA